MEPIKIYIISDDCILIGDHALEEFDKALRKAAQYYIYGRE